MKRIVQLTVNGIIHEIAVEPNAVLADVLREQLHLVGVKKGCDDGDCGACSVLCDGKVIPSCTTLACEVEGKEITTIEGVKQGDELHPVQKAFIDCFAVQCGFCTPGMIGCPYKIDTITRLYSETIGTVCIMNVTHSVQSVCIMNDSFLCVHRQCLLS